jgi:flavodoxin
MRSHEFKRRKMFDSLFFTAGNNYGSGQIVEFPVGNTEIVAKMIQEIIGADLFNIDSVNSYPEILARSSPSLLYIL